MVCSKERGITNMLYHYTIEGQEFDLDEFTQGYLEAALWSSTDNTDEQGGESLDKNYTIRDLALGAMQSAIEDCRTFQEDNATDLEEAYDLYQHSNEWTHEAQAGHDFWLTRNSHGVGFWDRGIGEVGNRLTQASHTFKRIDLYAGDDGRLYFS